MARCTVRSSSIKDSTSGGASTSVVIDKPAGLAVGDELVFGGSAVDATYTLPSGWSQRTTQGGSPNLSVFVKTADSTDVAASTFTFALSASSRYAAVLIAVQNPDQTVPVVNSSSTQGTTTSPSTTGFDPGREVLLIIIVGFLAGANRTVSSPAVANNNPSWSSINATTDLNGVISVYTFSGSYAATTTTGNGSATISGAVTGEEIMLLALQPEVVRPGIVTAVSSTLLPTIVKTVSVSVLSAAAAAITPSVVVTLKKWANQAKSAVSSFTDVDKS